MLASSPHEQQCATLGLTCRQMEVFHYLAQGWSYKVIGNTMNISYCTVKNHASAIYKKLNVNSSSEAVRQAQRLGISLRH